MFCKPAPAAGVSGSLSASGDHFVVQNETALLLNEPCPPAVVGKDWHTLFRRKLNIAWLPADKVFLPRGAIAQPATPPKSPPWSSCNWKSFPRCRSRTLFGAFICCRDCPINPKPCRR